MTQPIRRRGHLAAALTITAVLSFFLVGVPAVQASAATSRPRASQVPAKICPIDWRRGPWHVKRLIRCAAFHWNVPGGARRALYIANRESHFDPRAYNPSGCAGVYQHMLRYWPVRATTHGFRGWSPYNARANIIVTMRMVHRGSWGPWGY
jgi:hypothetical protein